MAARFGDQELAELLRRNPDLGIEGEHLTKPDKITVKNNPILDTPDLNEHFGKAVTGITWQQWQDKVINLLRANGWLARIIRPAMTGKGWRTPIQGDEGEPDIFAVHPQRLLIWWIECKTGKGSLSAKQEKWVMALSKCQAVCPNVRMDVLRPEEWEEFKKRVEEG
jgi:hypothetical protein